MHTTEIEAKLVRCTFHPRIIKPETYERLRLQYNSK